MTAKYYVVIFCSLLLIGSNTTGEIIDGLNPDQPQKEIPASYISASAYELVAVVSPAPTLIHFLRLPNRLVNLPDSDSNSGLKSSDGAVTVSKTSLLFFIHIALPQLHVRYLLYPFHSFL